MSVAAMRARQRGFTPRRLPGLRGWWRADGITGLADGDAVSTWPDRSGQAFDAVQTAGNRPVWKTGIVNGRPVVRFTAASSQFMRANGAAAGFTGTDLPLSVIAVLKFNAAAGTGVFASLGRSTPVGTGTSTMYFRQNTSLYTVLKADDGSAAATVTGGTPDTSWHVVVITHTGTTTSCWVDGTNVINAGAQNLGLITHDLFGIGARTSSTSSPVSGYMDGDIAELVVCNQELSTSDRLSLQTYAGVRYALTIA